MKNTRVVKDESGTVDLCETFTDTEGKVLRQEDTGTIYGSSVIDLIEGYDEETGKPFSRFTYEEIDDPEAATE